MLAFSLIFGGALGNILDRLFRSPGWGRGGVVDFVDLRVWPIFNVADASLVVGVIVMVLVIVLQARSASRDDQAATTERPPPAQGAR